MAEKRRKDKEELTDAQKEARKAAAKVKRAEARQFFQEEGMTKTAKVKLTKERDRYITKYNEMKEKKNVYKQRLGKL